MTQLDLKQQKSVNLLEAQGRLNKDIQIALDSFRQKLKDNMSMNIQSGNLKGYQCQKQGPEKVFQFRQSLLSLMFEIKDFKTLYNMVIASFIILTCTLLLSNFQETGQFINHDQLRSMFSGFHRVLIYWLALVIIHFTIIPITKVGIKYPKRRVWLPLYLIHQSSLLGLAMNASQHQQLGFASVVVLMAEATRMLMKSHSYFRTKMLYLTDNQYKDYDIKGFSATNLKPHQQANNDFSHKKQANSSKKQKAQKKLISVGQKYHKTYVEVDNNDIFTEFKNLSYFFVAPTIIYRDRYILTPIRSMSKIIENALNFLACIYYSFMLYVLTCKPAIKTLETKTDFSTFVLTVIKLMLPSTFFLLLGFFGFLHSWLNCWAQITRFPDRCFYSDWWNSIEFGSYYRKWNIVVHDWLYYFIYLDFCRFTKCNVKSKLIPKLATFLISAFIHELIITYAVGFFYPILFILFTGPGIILIQNQKNLRVISVNLAFWVEMYIGSSLLFTFYLIEVFARKRISDDFIMSNWGAMGYFIPRTLYLGQQM